MLLNLKDYRFLIDGFVDYYQQNSDKSPPPYLVRYLTTFFPDSLRQHWATLTEKHQEAGKPWQQAEWEAFAYFVRDTARYESQHPEKPIKWAFPVRGPDHYSDNQILPDERFFHDLELGRIHNESLKRTLLDQISEDERKLRETAEALKNTDLKLAKETTVKKRSTVKKEPKPKKEQQGSSSGRKKKSKFDGNMGALFS